MIDVICTHCGKKLQRNRRNKNNTYFCNASCQLNYEYSTGKRNKKDIVSKAQNIAHKKLKQHNWLNNVESRENLRKIQQSEEYRLKMSEMRIGDKNPMFGKYGKEAGHYKGGSLRLFKTAFRGIGWKLKKAKIKERDNYCCQKCGINEEELIQNLQVHHIVPYKCTQDNSDENLITLCSKCHASEEPKFYKIKSIKKKKYSGNVYNFSVLDDESYVANKMVVHNCRSTLAYVQVDDDE